MIEPIDKEKAAVQASRSGSSKEPSQGSSSGSASQGHGLPKHKSQPQPELIKEEEDEDDRARSGSDPIRPTYFLSPSPSHLASSSPGELSPAEEAKAEGVSSRGDRKTDPLRPTNKAIGSKSMLSTAAPRAQTMDPKAGQPSYFPPVPIAAMSPSTQLEADVQQSLGGSAKRQQADDDGVLRKDTALTHGEKKERKQERGEEVEEPQDLGPDGWGQSFNIRWIKIGSLPFGRTRHLRNPWNADREVKVSRDGTEVEPSERL
jgi:hypothetical protein